MAALAWGKTAYLAMRRLFYCWLPFIDIAAEAPASIYSRL
jgi:hypothetical protein